MTILITKKSNTPSAVPTLLALGELAVNTADAKLWVGNGTSSVLLNPALVLSGSVNNQSARWDNTAQKWIPNSNITMTAAGVLTAVGLVGPLTGNVTGNASGSSGSCTGNAATATLAADSSKLNNQLPARYPTSTTDSLKFVISATDPVVNNLDTITFVTA